MANIELTISSVSPASPARVLEGIVPTSATPAKPFSELLQTSLPALPNLIGGPENPPVGEAVGDRELVSSKLKLEEVIDLLADSLSNAEAETAPGENNADAIPQFVPTLIPLPIELPGELREIGKPAGEPAWTERPPQKGLAPQLPGISQHALTNASQRTDGGTVSDAIWPDQVKLLQTGRLTSQISRISPQAMASAFQATASEMPATLESTEILTASREGEDKPSASLESGSRFPSHLGLAEAVWTSTIPIQMPLANSVVADPFPVSEADKGGPEQLTPSLSLSQAGGVSQNLVAANPDPTDTGWIMPQTSELLAPSAALADSEHSLQAVKLSTPEFEYVSDVQGVKEVNGSESLGVNDLAPEALTTTLPNIPPIDTTSPTAPAIDTPVELHKEGWGVTLGHQLVWMVHHRAQKAELKINPPHLGPLEVQLSLNQEQTSVTFICHDAGVREAIENALPRLRDMLDGQGIQLQQANVSQQSLADQRQGSDGQLAGQQWGWEENHAGAEPSGEQTVVQRIGMGIVDQYV